ncbi:alpha/beta fold hydrolase [Microbispora sp. NEAU-D428]|uniref:alpha/beta hydrolase n=1 Tax=Microbispora sitophila TaxID=2771537 RepID=UPI001866AA28|nr:alpha/beta hydrolase [Microbispora sitophila]MBE3008795.1 alpha/beta fold hydrolase [Microbispora sitophila]
MNRIASAAAVISLSTALVAAPSTARAAPAWTSCGTGAELDPRQECATLQVPLTYGRPGGGTISLAVSRIRTARPGLRRGVLLLIPGGPGSPGLSRPSTMVKRLPSAVLDRYDLIGFDPRGVGLSSPVSCGLAHEDLAPSRLKPYPSAGGDISANVAYARRFSEACARNGGPLLRTISTRNEARDVDAIRRALGEERLSYWGVSYGTYAGAVYATMFPGRTDRVILDSNDDPDPHKVARAWLANYSMGVEDRFPDFAAWAAERDDEYGLGADGAAVRRTFLDLAERLDRAPIPWPGANPPRLDGAVLRETMLNALYSDTGFPALAGLMRAGLGSAPLPEPSTAPDAALQNAAASVAATICNDVEWPGSADLHRRLVTRDRAAHPLTGGMPVNIGPCAYWPYRPAEAPMRVTSQGPSNVLLVQNLRDPATPYSGALRMREALGSRARMVAVDSGGHGSYLVNGNACGDDAVTTFLVSGERPARDTICR